MGTKHIHAEVIKAWSDGADIEFQFPSDNPCRWRSCDGTEPGWRKDVKYRVKPKNIVVTRNVSFNSKYGYTQTYVSSDPNIKFEFTPEGTLVSVEMLK